MSGKCDVIVIGAGASGMTAAIAAKNAGAKILYEEITELDLSAKIKTVTTSKQKY